MAISGINNSYNTLDLASILSEAKSESESDSDSDSILSTSSTLASSNSWLESMQSKKAQSAYGGGAASALGQAALQRALSEMNSGGTVSFSDIADYRKDLEAQFSDSVRLNLAGAGVSPDTEFSISMSADGKIAVDCDDPVAKEKIEQYLSDNPKVCDQFGYIQALSNLERARQGPLGGTAMWQQVRSAKTEMQASALESFFDESLNSGMNYASLLAEFGAGATDGASSASFYAGLDFTV